MYMDSSNSGSQVHRSRPRLHCQTMEDLNCVPLSLLHQVCQLKLQKHRHSLLSLNIKKSFPPQFCRICFCCATSKTGTEISLKTRSLTYYCYHFVFTSPHPTHHHHKHSITLTHFSPKIYFCFSEDSTFAQIRSLLRGVPLLQMTVLMVGMLRFMKVKNGERELILSSNSGN